MIFDRDAAMESLAAAVSAPGGDLRIRLTLDESGEFQCTAAALAKSSRLWTYAISPLRVRSDDAIARHKTNWREHLDREHARLSRETGCDEVVFLNERGEVAEGSRSNVFLRRDGMLLTPPLSAGVLDGCLRRELVEQGLCREATLTLEDLKKGEVCFGNSLRGLMEAAPVTVAFETA